MSYFYDFNEQGFLHSGLHDIPKSAIAISEEQYHVLLKGLNKGQVIVLKAGELVLEEKAEQAVKFDLNFAKTQLIGKIADKTDRLKEGLMHGYPQTEIDSFYRQEQEARAYLADNTAKADMLSQIATVRNIPLELLAQAVVRKADQFAAVIGTILGQKQQFEDRIEKAKTAKALSKIEEEVEQWSI